MDLEFCSKAALGTGLAFCEGHSEWGEYYFFCTLSLSDGQMVIDKNRMATTGSRHTATVKMMVSQMYGCLKALDAVPVKTWTVNPRGPSSSGQSEHSLSLKWLSVVNFHRLASPEHPVIAEGMNILKMGLSRVPGWLSC